MAKVKKKKKVEEKIDGLNPKDIQNIRKALRPVWSWSYPRKLCIKRAMSENDIGKCEHCKAMVGKLYADHKQVMGDVLAPDYIKRMWTPSKNLQALCANCHRKKTQQERKEAAKASKDDETPDFF